MLTATIRQIVIEALETISIPSDTVQLTIPADTVHGDFTTNIALIHAKRVGARPIDLARQIAQAIPTHGPIEHAEAVPPGFVNIFVKPKYLLQAVAEYHVSEPIPSDLTGRSYTVEYTDPNPFKEFHIGHLYSNTAGEAISRLLEAVGANVRRVNYQGDVGIHVACSVWGMIKKVQGTEYKVQREKVNTLKDIEELPLGERVRWMGQCYAKGATVYREDDAVKRDIQTLNAQIFLAAQTMWGRERSDFTPHVDYNALIKVPLYPQDMVQYLYEQGRAWTLAYFETIYKRLGTDFGDQENYYFESYIGELGYELVHQHLDDGIFERSDGAIVFKGEQYGLHTRVFINSFGLPTYEAKEMGLNPTKYKDHPFDTSLIITADEIEEYFKVVLKAMSMVAPEVASRTRHIAHGVVRLPEGKMSSRTGKIISGETLIDEARSRLLPRIQESGRIPDSELEPTSERLAIASVKYSFLRSSLGKDVVFDFDESLSFEGDSGPYLLYTIVRCRSILDKAGIHNANIQPNLDFEVSSLEFDIALLRLLIHFPDVVASAAVQYAPHVVCTYLHKLAQEFNSYYGKVQILQADAETKPLKLWLTRRVADVLTRGVDLLGFKTVERM